MGVYLYTDEWLPTSDTVAYYPFESDQLDKVGSTYLNKTGTKQSIGYLFSSTTNIIGISGDLGAFVSYWVKFNNGSNGAVMNTKGTMRINNRIDGINYAGIIYKNSGGSFINLGNAGINNGTWYYVAYGFNGNSYKVYINGNEIFSGNDTPNIASDPWIVNGSGVILSNLIYSKAMRTAQEITDYYNSTKSNYGL